MLSTPAASQDHQGISGACELNRPQGMPELFSMVRKKIMMINEEGEEETTLPQVQEDNHYKS